MSTQQETKKRRTRFIIATIIAIIIVAVSVTVVYYSNMEHLKNIGTNAHETQQTSKPGNENHTSKLNVALQCRMICGRYISSEVEHNSWYNDTITLYRTVLGGTYVNASKLMKYKSMLDKSVRSAIAWADMNLIMKKSLINELGTPEIIYLNTRTGTALIYIGLQMSMSDFMKYRGDIFSKVVAKNEVPSGIRESIYNTFITCLEDFEKGKACKGGILIRLNQTQIKVVEEILNRYGIKVREGSDTLYVIFVVSPTCPFCKTEILSLYLSGVFTNGTLPGNPTIIIMPVPEHGFPDMLYVAQLYCIYSKHRIFMPVLLYMYHHYTMNGNLIYFPNSSKIDELYNISLIECLNLPSSNITLIYTKIPIEGGYLYATMLNCTRAFYENCMKSLSNGTR